MFWLIGHPEVWPVEIYATISQSLHNLYSNQMSPLTFGCHPKDLELLSVTTQAHGVGQCSHSMMSAPSAVCCTYGTPLIMPLQFQDWTQIEESDGEDVHTTAVLGFIVSGGGIVRCLTLSTSVLRRDNSRSTSFRS